MKKRVKREGRKRGKNKYFGKKLVALDLSLPESMLNMWSSCAPKLTDGFPGDEIHDVFGDGHEYDWVLVGDDEAEYVI